MTEPTESLYDVLGVSRKAKPGEIVRAYDRLVAEFRKDSTPPDPRREARVREAFEALSDPGRRDAYDASLLIRPVRRRGKHMGPFLAVAIVAAGAALYVALRPGAPSQPPGRALQEILAEASKAVGRVHAVEMSGTAIDAGLAFAIEPGVMLTTCQKLTPGAQISVIVAPRTVPARISMTDESKGLCKLAVDGAASWPLPVGSTEPKVGDKVYVASVGAAGEAVLTETSVKRVTAGEGGRLIEVAMAVPAALNGGPLLDRWGRAVGVATLQPDGQARHVVLPSDWAAQERPRRETPATAAPAPAQPAAAPAEPGQPDPAAMPKTPGDPRAKDLAGKLRPPPNVPDDL